MNSPESEDGFGLDDTPDEAPEFVETEFQDMENQPTPEIQEGGDGEGNSGSEEAS